MTRPVTGRRRRLILLGSAGSIGTSAVEVIDHLNRHGDEFDVVGLATGSNAACLAEQAERLDVKHVALRDAAAARMLQGRATVFTGHDASRSLIEAIAEPGDLVIGAIVGSAGIPAILAAIERGCDIALANKETLVAAGRIVIEAVRRRGVSLLPIDSEHSAIFQCLSAGRSIEEVRRLIITASGGPFRSWSAERVHGATVAEALDHPTWTMGRKITIDSATLMNKALEVIEAHWLFDLPGDQIETIVHPQSIVHSFVEFVDGSVLAQLGPPDMRGPIQYALTWPVRAEAGGPTMRWDELSELRFEPVAHDVFPAIRLAGEVIERGGTSGAIFNAANEAAVEAFLGERIPFGAISMLVERTLESVECGPAASLEAVLDADHRARAFVAEELERTPTAFARSGR